MPLERPSIDTIYNRIKADIELRLTGNVKLPRFSMLSILAKVFAGAIHLCYGVLTWLADQLFPDTAKADYLERLAALKGLTRRAATFAQGSIQLSGVAGTLIPQGTIWIDSNDNEFATVDNYTLNVSGFAEARVQATVAGSASNSSSAKMEILNPINNIDSVANVITEPAGGAEEETDDQLRNRLLFVWQEPPAGGRSADYIQWATEISGVGKAWVLEAYNGVSTVGIIVAGFPKPGYGPVDASILADVDANIDNNRPLGIIHETINLDTRLIGYNISLPEDSSQELQDSITNELQTLHNSIGAPGGTISVSSINFAIITAGATTYTLNNISIDGISIGVNNIIMPSIQYPVFDTIIFGVL